MEWISVKDRLPEDNEECLVWPIPNRDFNILSACFQPWDKKWTQDAYMGHDYEDFEPAVDFWMPMPAPPTKEGKT